MNFKKIKDFFENNQFIILRYTFIVYAMIILKGFERPIVDLITSHYPKWLNLAFLLIQDTLWINWATFILTIIISLYLLYCLLRKKDGVAGITLLLVLFFIFSYRDFTPLKFIDLPFSNRVNYRLLFDILLCLIFIIGSFKHGHYQILNKKRDVPRNKNLQDVGWKEYALELVEKVKKLDSEESFAIGVSGTWGSGKTTFLKHIKDNLKDDKFIVIDFEPWSCIDSNQIIQEFFKKLSDNFKNSHKQLLKDVKSYAKMISHFDDSLWISKASDIFFRSDESLSNTKKQLEAEIDRIDKKIIIFIDDLDRLGNEELYEVLKLIRVTANFKNIIYIVAYDTTYVGKLLEDYGGSSFLKKIINLEISLPGYEEYHLPTILYDELKKLSINEEYLKLIKPAIFQQTNQGYLVTKYLNCFRDVKRFAQIFTLNLNQITSKLSTLNIDLYDFFLIELLHYSYPETYNILKENPDNLLNTNLGYHYTVKNQPGSTNKHESNNNSTGSIPNKVWVLLHFIFGDNPNHKSNSIQNVESFYEYFYYRNQNDKLSIEDYYKILNANSDQEIENTISDWFTDEIQKYPFSISVRNRFQNESTEYYDEKQAKNYLSAIIKFSRYTINDIHTILLNKLRKGNYDYSLHNILHTFLKTIIPNEIKKNTNKFYWPATLHQLVETLDSTNGKTINSSLLSNEDIKELFDEYYKFWMQNEDFKKSFDFKEIFNPNSDIFKIMKSSSVKDYIYTTKNELNYINISRPNHNYILLGKDHIFELLKCDNEKTFNEYTTNLEKYFNSKETSLSNCVNTLFATKKIYIEFIDTCVSGVNPETIIKHKEEIFGKPTTNVPFNRQNQNSR